jgi:hypothetical protein
MKKIVVRHSFSYGKHQFWPDNDYAHTVLLFCKPGGNRKVFTIEQIEAAKALGFEVEIKPMEFDTETQKVLKDPSSEVSK